MIFKRKSNLRQVIPLSYMIFKRKSNLRQIFPLNSVIFNAKELMKSFDSWISSLLTGYE